MIFLTDVLYTLLSLAVAPMVVYRMIRNGRYRLGWSNRLGFISRKNPEKPCIWIHAVSVGEVNATQTLITAIEERFEGYEIVVTSTTDTGYARAFKLYGKRHTVCYFPLDFSWAINTALRQLRPSVCVLMELEVWPNLIRLAHRRKIPVVVANGRLSQRSFTGYCRIKPLIKPIFSKLSLVLAQSNEYAERFSKLGVDPTRISVVGSLKYDTAEVADKVEGADELADQLGLKGKRLWVTGGTGPEEEKIILDAYRKVLQDEDLADLRLAIVPRKPERFDEVADIIRQMGLGLLRYSLFKAGQAIKGDKKAVILGDTMGDLRKFYSLSTVVFVGRTLVPMGGSDMAEAAALRKFTIFGPYTFNFNQTVTDLLESEGAIEVQNGSELVEIVRKCLKNSDFSQALAQRGQETIIRNQGATERALDKMSSLLRT